MRLWAVLIIFVISNAYSQSFNNLDSNLDKALQQYDKQAKKKPKKPKKLIVKNEEIKTTERQRIQLEGQPTQPQPVQQIQEPSKFQNNENYVNQEHYANAQNEQIDYYDSNENAANNEPQPQIKEIPLDELPEYKEGYQDEFSLEHSEEKHNEADFAASTVGDDKAKIIPSGVLAIMQKHKVYQGDVSIMVQNVARNNPLVSLNADVLRHPASVTKVLTTAAGLLKMGANYQWHTDFYVNVRPDAEGVLNGDLFVKGGGDPFLVEERLEEVIQEIRAKGIRHINGNIVLDNSLYHLSKEEKNTESFDGNPHSAYNAIPAPFMVNFNSVKIIFSTVGKGRVDIKLSPAIKNWRVKNQLKINSGKCGQNFAPKIAFERDSKGYADLTVSGIYSVNCGRQELNAVLGESTELFYYLFKELWAKHGGSLDGGGKFGKIPPNAELLISANSLPLADAITKMNTFSNNVMTRQLMLTLGAYVYGEPGDLEKGRTAVKNTLQEFGVNMDGAFIDNGSGLSRETVISARMFNQLLVNLYRSNAKDTFMHSLAVAGQTGTLRKRMRGSVLEGNVIGKTGTIKGVRAFAGYVYAKSGHIYSVVIIGNGKSAGAAKGMQDDLFSWVYKQ